MTAERNNGEYITIDHRVNSKLNASLLDRTWRKFRASSASQWVNRQSRPGIILPGLSIKGRSLRENAKKGA